MLAITTKLNCADPYDEDINEEDEDDESDEDLIGRPNATPTFNAEDFVSLTIRESNYIFILLIV